MNKVEAFDNLAKQNGFFVTRDTYKSSSHLKVRYYTHDGNVKFRSVQIETMDYKPNNTAAKASCLVKVTFGTEGHNKYMNFSTVNVDEAYALAYALLFMPESVRYEFVRGSDVKKLTLREFSEYGHKETGCLHELLVLPGYFLIMLLFPIAMIIGLIYHTIGNIFQRWENVCQLEDDNLILIRRYCAGKRQKFSIKALWMSIDTKW